MRKQIRRRVFRVVRESAAVLACAALLSSLLPHVLGSTQDPERLVTQNTCERVRAALAQFSDDTGVTPGRTEGRDVSWLLGPGDTPLNFSSNDAGTLSDVLAVERDRQPRGYQGPYLQFGGSDSWGRSIVAHVGAFGDPDQTAWILSAGPNGRLETSPHDNQPQGDDIGVILESR